jgi:ABC-type uncharacterized transport system permease subunit
LAFQRQLAYRFANLSGLVTNGFFGLLRAYVIIALFGARPAVAGYSIGDAITYTGLAQALIAYIALWGWWDLMREWRLWAYRQRESCPAYLSKVNLSVLKSAPTQGNHAH